MATYIKRKDGSLEKAILQNEVRKMYGIDPEPVAVNPDDHTLGQTKLEKNKNNYKSLKSNLLNKVMQGGDK